MKKKLLFSFTLLTSMAVMGAEEKLIVVNEGTWETDNGRLSYFEDGKVVSNEWFREINGYKLGDTPADIIQVKDDLIAIAVRSSNLLQFIKNDGTAVAAVENLPNIRCLATDGRYVYVTSYAHECETTSGTSTFQKGYVAKIDTEGYSVVAACETGYEPEGIALYNGKLFVANSGGYSFQEDHDYESTIYIIDPEEMRKSGEIETNHLNLYGRISQTGKYLCINSAGNYYDVAGCGIILDCDKALSADPDCYATIPYLVTYNSAGKNDTFIAVGSEYSFAEGGYIYTTLSIDPAKVMASKGKEGYTTTLPGSMTEDIKKMTSPYGIYMNPYTGMYYATDAGTYGSAGTLWQWSPSGEFINKYPVYINPGWFLALKPASYQDSVDSIEAEGNENLPIYDLTGQCVRHPLPGQIYIRNGKKFIMTR